MLKRFLYEHPRLFDVASKIMEISNKDVFHKRMKVKSLGGGYVRICKHIIGNNNYMEIGRNCHLFKAEIYIVGNNNKIILEDNCRVGKNCSFRVEGDNILIYIGKNTSFTRDVQLCAQEANTSIKVGNDCMFSNNIIVRTSDSHPIYDNKRNRINPAKSVLIGEHVWIAPNSKILKGVVVGNGCIIGSDTMVTKSLPDNVLAVGHPAKIVKEDILWTRESLF